MRLRSCATSSCMPRSIADVIRRFGRFPHRNAALGRVSTAAEQAYLRESTKDFGQVARRRRRGGSQVSASS